MKSSTLSRRSSVEVKLPRRSNLRTKMLSQSLMRQLADQQGLTWSLIALGHTARSLGQMDTAQSLLNEGLLLASRTGDRLSIADALQSVAVLCCQTHPRQAAQLASGAVALRTRCQLQPELERARAAIGDQAFARAWQDGEVSSVEVLIKAAADVVGDSSSKHSRGASSESSLTTSGGASVPSPPP
jgi:hypothetical protein